jgi:hypothetical protein
MKKFVNGVLIDMTEEEIAWQTNALASAQQKEAELKAERVRGQRDDLLRLNVDSLNPIRWAAFTDAQKAAFGVYRQALLDVPQQAGFPDNVTWPNKPE